MHCETGNITPKRAGALIASERRAWSHAGRAIALQSREDPACISLRLPQVNVTRVENTTVTTKKSPKTMVIVNRVEVWRKEGRPDMSAVFERLTEFIVAHEICAARLEIGHADRVESPDWDIVLRCSGCGAGVSVAVTVEEAQAYVFDCCRGTGFHGTAEQLRAANAGAPGLDDDLMVAVRRAPNLERRH